MKKDTITIKHKEYKPISLVTLLVADSREFLVAEDTTHEKRIFQVGAWAGKYYVIRGPLNDFPDDVRKLMGHGVKYRTYTVKDLSFNLRKKETEND